MSDATSRHKIQVGASAETWSADLPGCRDESGGVGVEVRSLELGAVGGRWERLGRVKSPNGSLASSGSARGGREALAWFGRVAESMRFRRLAVAVQRV